MTQIKDVQKVTMQKDCSLAFTNSDGEFVWGPVQALGPLGNIVVTGESAFLRLHDNGDIGAYVPHDDGAHQIWTSGTGVVVFRAVHFINRSSLVYTYPLVKDKDGNHTLWDGKAANIFTMVSQSTPGYSQIAIDGNRAWYVKDGSTYYLRYEAKGVMKLGHNVRWGDDVWVKDRLFAYDADSKVTVHIAGEKGRAWYEGYSTNGWFHFAEDGLLTGADGTLRKPDFNEIRM